MKQSIKNKLYDLTSFFVIVPILMLFSTLIIMLVAPHILTTSFRYYLFTSIILAITYGFVDKILGKTRKEIIEEVFIYFPPIAIYMFLMYTIKM